MSLGLFFEIKDDSSGFFLGLSTAQGALNLQQRILEDLDT